MLALLSQHLKRKYGKLMLLCIPRDKWKPDALLRCYTIYTGRSVKCQLFTVFDGEIFYG